MSKVDLKLRCVVTPVPTVIVSAYDENGRADACTLGLSTMVSHNPPCVLISINATARRKTLQDILRTKAFVIGYPTVEQFKEADYLGVESGYETDKLRNIGYTTTKAQTVNAPVLDAMKLSIECKVIHTAVVGSHMQITGEIQNILADEGILDETEKNCPGEIPAAHL